MGRWSAPTGSTPRSSTASSRAWSSTTPSYSTTSSPSGKPSTTTIVLTAPSAARPPTNALGKRPQERPRVNDQHQLHTGGAKGTRTPDPCLQSDVSARVSGPDLHNRVSLSDRYVPLGTGGNGTLMAR